MNQEYSSIKIIETGTPWRIYGSGALAGAITTLIFTIIHQIFISDIWFSYVIMTLAGIICGSSFCWSYLQLFNSISLRSWIILNLLFDIFLFLLAPLSLYLFEPITTISAVLAANEPPADLINKALPMTVIYTLIMACCIHILYGSGWKSFLSTLITCMLVIGLLGLNVSAIGLVSFGNSSFYLVLELLLLILVINLVFVISVIALNKYALKNNTFSQDPV